MIRKHKLYFWFWKLWLSIIGIKVGTEVSYYNKEDDATYYGKVICLCGASITKSKWGADIMVRFDTPLQGDDDRYFTQGSYTYKEFKKSLEIVTITDMVTTKYIRNHK